ncbi:MAG TPA: YqaE/Pmp3 family membrane protein [Chitinophagaceae bacterium]|nr:YqaE/Pmp3 family membrane protein [Chitinophagaceae bacterium]
MKKALFFTMAFLIAATSFTGYSYAALVVPASSAMPVSSEPDPATAKSAVNEFKNLSKKEKKARIKDAKKELKAYKAAKRAGAEPSTNTLLLVILAILLPPLAVYLHQGEINSKFWISLLLTLLFWLPGVIYALIVILGNE